MELIVKMNSQEALATVEKGTLASLIQSAESEVKEKPATTDEWPNELGEPAPEIPQTPAPQEPTPEISQAPAPQAPVSAVSYSADDLQKAAIGLMDMGKQPELIALLRSFGVEALPALPQDKYDAFALKLRELGARI